MIDENRLRVKEGNSEFKVNIKQMLPVYESLDSSEESEDVVDRSTFES